MAQELLKQRSKITIRHIGGAVREGFVEAILFDRRETDEDGDEIEDGEFLPPVVRVHIESRAAGYSLLDFSALTGRGEDAAYQWELSKFSAERALATYNDWLGDDEGDEDEEDAA